ncbi:MAG: PAS domain-containing protein [Proteobacteria bacterium]|nr:response regulator [Desulfocapsa sp.]MBU3943642.1 PAS domain-containing protein [Pseudomonadota bacterium]MCG2743055.1 PAS domain-containing protein [Desulfobacteraceae bacterium]MBU3983718.1 PAS domain-containing protein [Pseudomonadota bacterium]MBU4028692.1 PAS domain-containing protein [Pseudomonadota bacterium]
MNLISRYPVRFVLPFLLLFLAFIGTGASYLFLHGTRNRLIEKQALHFVTETMGRNQSRLNAALRDKDMKRLKMNMDLLADDAARQGTTLVADDKQTILSASNPAWVGQSLVKVAIPGEGKVLLEDFSHNRDRSQSGRVVVSRDRQTILAVTPLIVGEDPTGIGLVYHEHDLRILKQAAQQTLRRNMFFVFSLFAVIALLIWLYLYFVFFRRVLRIIQTTEQFGQGDNTARSALTGSDELALVSTALDGMLTQRVAEEKRIRENARMLKLLTDGLPVLIAYVDKDERYRLVNQEFEHWFYLQPDQIVGKQVRDLLGEKGYGEIAEYVHQALSGKVVEYEAAMPIVNGGMRQFRATLLPHFENGSGVQGCFLLAQDITQQRLDQDLLRKAKALWERTFDSILEEIITVQDKDFRILQANSAAAQFFDTTKEDLIGRHCYELFREENIPCLECPAHAVLQGGKIHSIELYHARLKKNFLVTVSPMLDEQGDFFGIVHSAKDITEFKLLEGQLRQAQKMEAIGTLAGGIAHDFNNILTPILGYSEMLAERLPENSDERKMVLDIRTAGMRATELVKQILTFSRQSEQQRQPLQIHLIIKEALKLLRSSIPTTIAIHQDVVDCGLVMADPTQVHQIIMNLCTNAYHAMRETGGELNVSMEVVELTAQDYLDSLALQPGPHVKLSVCDTGCGMSKELQERIFEPYYTTKKQGEGTGLGLSVVHGIIKSHHGHITVYSEPGKGTEFHVYLPQMQAHDQILAEETGAKIPKGSGTVLVVDDEPIIGEMLQRMLCNMGYEVLLCSSSTQALEVFTQQRARIALVLTDMNMPVMNGGELARRIKQLSPVMPVVLCTGFSEIMDEEKARRMGIDGYMTKPVIQRQLAQTLHDVLEKKGGSGPAA